MIAFWVADPMFKTAGSRDIYISHPRIWHTCQCRKPNHQISSAHKITILMAILYHPEMVVVCRGESVIGSPKKGLSWEQRARPPKISCCSSTGTCEGFHSLVRLSKAPKSWNLGKMIVLYKLSIVKLLCHAIYIYGHPSHDLHKS